MKRLPAMTKDVKTGLYLPKREIECLSSYYPSSTHAVDSMEFRKRMNARCNLYQGRDLYPDAILLKG